MTSTISVTGALLASFVEGTVTGLLLAAVVGARYRRRVATLMRSGGPPLPETAIDTPLRLHGSSHLGPVDLERAIRVNVSVLVAVTAVVSVILAWQWLTLSDIGLGRRWMVFALAVAWVGVVANLATRTAGRPSAWKVLVVYAIAYIGLGLTSGGLTDLWDLFRIDNLLPTALVVPVIWRWRRGAAALLVAVASAGYLVANLITLSVVRSDSVAETVVSVEQWITPGFDPSAEALVAWVGVLVFRFLAGLIVGAGFLVVSAWAFGRRFASDRMVLLGTVFGVFAVTQLVPDRPASFALVTVALIAGGVLFLVGHRILRVSDSGPVLVVLRVFSPDRSRHRLMEEVSETWRSVGPVRMIGAPDLALANLGPASVLTFLSGRLDRLFVSDNAVLRERMAETSDRPDPDGRYRPDEFFCFDNTWQVTVAELIAEADVIVMDLRGFTPDNQGCVAELGILQRVGALDRTIAVADPIAVEQLRGLQERGVITGSPSRVASGASLSASSVVKKCLEAVSCDTSGNVLSE